MTRLLIAQGFARARFLKRDPEENSKSSWHCDHADMLGSHTLGNVSSCVGLLLALLDALALAVAWPQTHKPRFEVRIPPHADIVGLSRSA